MAKKIIAVILVMLIILPIGVSADTVFQGDWGLGFARSRTSGVGLTTGTVIKTYPYSSSADRSCVFFGQYDWQPGYTYVITAQFYGTQTSPLMHGGLDLFQSSGYTITGSQTGYDTISWNGVSILSDLDDPNDLIAITRSEQGLGVTYEIVFNNDDIGLESLEYLVARINTATSQALTIYDLGYQIDAIADPNGEEFNDILLDRIAQLQQSIENYQTNALQVLDQIKAGQDKTNESLDKLPETLDEALDKAEDREYDKATDDGDDNVGAAVDALTGVINVGSILDAIQPLITACSYAGTTSVWSFPSITLPAIDGVMDEMKLNDPINFDLTDYAAQYLPAAILTLIRSIGTIGIIVFAAKEIMRIVKGVGKNDG